MDKLLKILKENSDFTIAELASMVGLSENEVKEKIKEYESKNIIRAYQAVIDYDKIDETGVGAYIELKVAPQKDTGFDNIANILCEYDEIESVKLMAGPYDLLVTITGETIQEISNFVAKKIAPMEGILSTSTLFELKTYKKNGFVLVDEDQDNDEREMVR